MNYKLKYLSLAIAANSALYSGQADAAAAVDEDAAASIDEIVVTARHRQESLQEVPIAVTAFSEEKIESAGITDLDSFVNLTPNFIAREAFRSGVTYLTVRGITTGQQGFSPISYIVDGVKAITLDAVNQGALFDIERIEVLKGPQGALYGAGAIAGAVNVVTKKPTNETEGQITLGYAEGDDLTVKGAISGAIADDVLTYRFSGYLRDFGGIIDTTTGDKLDFENQASLRGRFIYTPNEKISADLRLSYTDINAGAAKQDRIDSLDLLNTFNSSTKPERGIIGEENRNIFDASIKVDIELPFATLTSISGYLDMEQDLFGSASWVRPPALGEDPKAGLFGPILGENAVAAGDIIDSRQDLVDDIESFTHDMRLTSNSDGPLRWIAGFEYIERETVNGLTLSNLNPGDAQTIVVNRFDKRKDKIWGVYAQINYDISEAMELTLAGRYDENDYTNRQFDPATGASIDQLDENGNPVTELSAHDSKFQPKVTLSYDLSDDLHGYVTYSEGYRFGFFNTGNLTAPEETKNYEVGFKSKLLDGRATLNGAVFWVDYSNQQLTSAIGEPPFRVTTNIPESQIKGFELEAAVQVTDNLNIGLGFGYLDTEIKDLGRKLDAVPEFTSNVSIDYRYPLQGDLELVSRLDWRHQGEFILNGGFFEIDPVDLVNLRLGIEGGNWSVTGYVKNALDEQYPTEPINFGAFIVRSYNSPRQGGVEFRYKF
ncbi:TonB-dependent receptor [Emcibacter nanhaiensis]|uniref:TonB-dependent receptor n=1 Tax=Emcibacter nanhaiensis TaxID=1505037 RepID=A0A501PF03_9PROT|nr:TonB-dependent receptor [Emcibacter nanhaiensis]TPD59000.1 TonB-dependent receptor [Emcibacter nanhaiensis]